MNPPFGRFKKLIHTKRGSLVCAGICFFSCSRKHVVCWGLFGWIFKKRDRRCMALARAGGETDSPRIPALFSPTVLLSVVSFKVLICMEDMILGLIETAQLLEKKDWWGWHELMIMDGAVDPVSVNKDRLHRAKKKCQSRLQGKLHVGCLPAYSFASCVFLWLLDCDV